MKPIFRVKTLTARHAAVMQEAIDAAQANARTRRLSSTTGEDLLDAARTALRERTRYADAVAFAGRNGSRPFQSGIQVQADCEGVPNSYKYAPEGTSAQLVLKRDGETGEEVWEFYAKRDYARKVAYGAEARTFAALDLPIGTAEDEDRTREVRERLLSRGWLNSNSQMRKFY